MECYACEKEARQRCPRCDNPYCRDHGGKLCARCLDPASAAPSNVVFRVSLFGLLAVSVLALWLLIRPPSVPGESATVVQPTAAPAAATPAPKSPAASPGGSPAASATPAASAAASPSPAPTPAVTPAPTPIKYTVQDGDTISSIAAAYGMTYLDLLAANGLTEDQAKLLHAGDVITIPAH